MSIYSISTDKEPFESLKWVTYLIKFFYRRKLKANCSNKSTFLLKTDPENFIYSRAQFGSIFGTYCKSGNFRECFIFAKLLRSFVKIKSSRNEEIICRLLILVNYALVANFKRRKYVL